MLAVVLVAGAVTFRPQSPGSGRPVPLVAPSAVQTLPFKRRRNALDMFVKTALRNQAAGENQKSGGEGFAVWKAPRPHPGPLPQERVKPFQA